MSHWIRGLGQTTTTVSTTAISPMPPEIAPVAPQPFDWMTLGFPPWIPGVPNIVVAGGVLLLLFSGQIKLALRKSI